MIALDCDHHRASSIAADAVGPVQPLAAHRGIALFSDTPRDLIVYGDRERIQQVLSIALDASLRATRIGGQISVRVAP